MEIVRDDLTGPAIAAFLEEHLADMYATSPPESVHALDLSGLRVPEVTFWTLSDGGAVLACGALKRLDAEHAEIKSMRVSGARRGEGLGSAMLRHLLAEAREAGYVRVSLETGSQPFFEPARRMYLRYGFELCEPFGDYVEDPNSVFMTMLL